MTGSTCVRPIASRTRVWHDPFICDMTRAYRHDSCYLRSPHCITNSYSVYSCGTRCNDITLLRRDSFRSVTWLFPMGHDSFLYMTQSHMCKQRTRVTWLVRQCDMPRPCGTWLIRIYTTYACQWHDSFVYAWRVNMNDMTYSCIRDVCMWATWLSWKGDMTFSNMT